MRQPPLFHRVLGDSIASVPGPIAALHDTGTGKTWHGTATVTAGSPVLARLICAVTRFPPPARDVPVTVEMKPDGDGELWRRWFGGFLLTSRLTAGPAPQTIQEQMRAVTVQLRLVPDSTGVTQIPEGVRVLGLKLPKIFWPTLDVRESASGSHYQFLVGMKLWGHLLLRYEGHLAIRSVE